MKEFTKRAVIFAIINAVIIGTFFLFNRNAAMPDYNIIYGTLVSLLLGFPYEIRDAKKRGGRPEVEGVGASIFGTLIAAGVIVVILLIAGVIV